MSEVLHVTLTGDTDLTLTRNFAAPARLVWRAVTEPDLITQWLWARVAPMILCEQDFQTGGAFRWVWQRVDGSEMGVSGKFVEIDAPKRLVHTELFDDDWTGGETLVTQTFDELAPQQSRLTMVIHCASVQGRAAMLASKMVEGMDETYAKLDALLPTLLSATPRSDFRIAADGVKSIVVTRSFAAPLAHVRAAHLDPSLVMQWMSDPRFPLASCEIDARVGGSITYVWAATDGKPMTVRGRFLELTPTRIVHTELFDPDWTGGEARVITDFTTRGDRTEMRVEVIYSSPAARDGVVEAGMYDGWEQCLDRMDALL